MRFPFAPLLTSLFMGSVLLSGAALGADLAPDVTAKIDAAVTQALADTGTPAASIAVVRDGAIAYVHAYGQARREPAVAATPAQRFAIGSVSKQFTAAALMLLVEDGTLSLDDTVGKFIPNLTDGDRITIRQVLSHTAGYRDFWPQDYVPAMMEKPITTDGIFDRWARVPLDFQPGESWQYSNTGFTIAARIVEKASGKPFFTFLNERVLKPLGLDAADIDQGPLGPKDAAGYTRFALGQPRPAPKEAAGWLVGAAQLALTPQDLARWDIALMQRKLLKPESWAAMETSVRLNNGQDTRYGLGLTVTSDGAARLLRHGGEVSGFLAENRVWPDLGMAIVVLVNSDYGDPAAIAQKISAALPLSTQPSATETATARAFLEGLAQGRADTAHLTANGAAYFSPAALADYAATLGPLGALKDVKPIARRLRGGFTEEIYQAAFASRSVRIVARADAGRYEQFMIYVD
ncbi:serine hydrolase domain-containing protein [Nitrospirillum pindoramense]|uniref:CubicO group peptidase (Beta-lactamase class C family) n=1 Tax=Nitrospirillum amazonense TaxID=28077 RepID=A0A560GR04_9PROT|nr:serine hydrolase domain-containing protein [Nitrospirillum amazonense]TWB36453.1 CubicO group peptidase (beta-lactamase class C family) [Nitrospirillum amazonense]